MNKKDIFRSLPRTLYCFADNVEMCRKLIEAGAKIIQFRNKTMDDPTFFQEAQEMVAMVKSMEDVVLIINDRVDIALEVEADGLHVGQEDENYHEVIRKAPAHMIIGVSARTIPLALAARKAGATYIGTGSVFPSSTKSDARVIGIEGLAEIAKAVAIPVTAIGGIHIDNIHRIVDSGAQFFAVISGLNDAPDIKARFMAFQRRMK